jgi:hypothetical protein
MSVLILIRLSNWLAKQKSGFPLFSRPGRWHFKWYAVNQWFNNILKRELVAR